MVKHPSPSPQALRRPHPFLTTRGVAPLFCATLLLLSCGRNDPLSPRSAETGPLASQPIQALRASRTLSESGPQHLSGTIGPGALYEIDVPAEWNGDLVLYAHGYTLPQLPVSVPNASDGAGAIRTQLVERGFAVAVTSFSENGYAAAEGARQVHQLRGLFVDRVGNPNRVFLIGQSLGGLIGIELAEKHSAEYAGALLVSGVLGGTRRQVNYVGDTRVIFDCLWPGVIPGTVTDVPDGAFPQGAILQALASDPAKLGALLCTFRDPRFRLPGTTPTQFVTSAVRVLGFQWLAAEDLIARTHQHELYDNDDVAFVGCAPPAVLAGINQCFVRYSSTPDAEAFMRSNYEPSGVLRIPVLAVHAQFDPVVPAGHEAVYAEKAAAAGSLGNLVQCVPPRYGHTEAFQAQEVVQAFEALVGWATSGQKPSCPVVGPS